MPCVFDGPINARSFLAYVTRFLVPTLRPGDIVVVDNLGSHKGKAVRRALRTSGAHLFFLPPYSPDLNPIEQVFAKLKALLRNAAPRSMDDTCNTIGLLLNEFTADGSHQAEGAACRRGGRIAGRRTTTAGRRGGRACW